MSNPSREVPGFGPSPSPICLVGEAPGANELVYKRPFVGDAGQELSRILKDANLPPIYYRESNVTKANYYVTNVFKSRPGPDSNDVKLFFTKRDDPAASLELPARDRTYLRSDFLPMVRGLVPELMDVGARVVVAFGNTALWALLGQTKISAFVGTVHPPIPARPFWVIPTYHPAAVLRQWNFRSIMVANLLRVQECLAKSGVGPNPAPPTQPDLKIKINPTLDEVEAFARRAVRARAVAIDVETAHGQIRTISFSIDPWSAFVIPFWEPPQPSYWPTLEGEVRAWEAVARICSSPALKIFQNGQYDIQYLWRVHGIPIRGPIFDTMLAAHAMEPELPKSLGFLAATHLDLPEWKTMRVKSEKDNEE